MKKSRFFRSSSIVITGGLILFLFIKWQSAPISAYNEYSNSIEEKQKGAHVFGRMDSTNFQHLADNNIEWITLVTWVNQEDINSSILSHHNGDSVMIKQRNTHWVERINLAQSLGFKVFLKPHIWINTPEEGEWRNDIFPDSDADWEIWGKGYRDFIIRFATIAQKANAEMFCIGTELSRLTVEKPEYWENLIKEVKSIYSGQLTYAANWHDEFEKISFWNELDYIGIQAYFPLTRSQFPNKEDIAKGWNKHLKQIKSVHKKYKKKVLFTEMGYRSTSDSAIAPWEWAEDPSNKDDLVSEETQANCYEVFFDKVWKKNWFAGVHFWQLRSDFQKDKRPYTLDFTPQGKLAESVLAEGFE